ncbi:hypothetical protein LF1_35040 [Rubripirellula obstinata]|uniref:Uncharacterized protein n=1 Tax=Rubripirellula obstinata TaxID=406547 RepID=A0A5B1CKV1_9BACT|nr:hypothetical protein LF1_35040 [Rubripirellula obstinata]
MIFIRPGIALRVVLAPQRGAMPTRLNNLDPFTASGAATDGLNPGGPSYEKTGK